MTTLDHFVRLANRGTHGGASGGERRAARIAPVIRENVPGLDADALQGLKEFIDLASSDYQAALALFAGPDDDR